MKLLHIVPRLPPAIDGIGDFATTLGAQLHSMAAVRSDYLGCERDLGERSAAALTERVRGAGADALLLHYAGYGYDRRGAPGWLVEGLENVARDGPPLLIFFHEIWTETRPWRRAFYHAPAQKRLVRRLQKAAAASITSTPRMQRRLRESGEEAELAPIPSAIPSIERTAALAEPHRLVVFGLEHTRERSVRAHARLLRALGGLAELWCVGRGASPEAADAKLARTLLGGGRVNCLADAAPAVVARQFAEASFCLSFYPLDYLTKSSSVTAALANGCPVALPPRRAREEFKPRPPVMMLDGSADSLCRELAPSNLSQVSEASRAWYREHADWPVLAGRLARMLAIDGQPMEAVA